WTLFRFGLSVPIRVDSVRHAIDRVQRGAQDRRTTGPLATDCAGSSRGQRISAHPGVRGDDAGSATFDGERSRRHAATSWSHLLSAGGGGAPGRRTAPSGRGGVLWGCV